MLDRRLNLGQYWGIGVYVHWTFAFLVAYVAFSTWTGGVAFVAFNVLLLLHVFFCVTLHEYGHALTARAFGVPTLDITLLPIGGVARLQGMPRQPWQEMLVAIAGPAVNAVIAVLLAGSLTLLNPGVVSFLMTQDSEVSPWERFDFVVEQPSVTAFALLLLAVNVALILFNMIPAFPMDGGRVLRSLMATMMSYRAATRTAFAVGVFSAAMLAVSAIYYQLPTAGLVSLFVIYAGLSETRQVEMTEKIRGRSVGDLMVADPPFFHIDTLAAELPELYQGLHLPAVPVVAVNQLVVGMMPMQACASRLVEGVRQDMTVGELLAEIFDEDSSIIGHAPKLRPDDRLESVLNAGTIRYRQFPVVNEKDGLIGVLDLDRFLARQS